jgi:hypothetical protein
MKFFNARVLAVILLLFCSIILIPWGLNIDGNEDIWVGNMWGRSVSLFAGDNTKGHSAGTKTGDVIHIFQSGSMEMINVWVMNNWQDIDSCISTPKEALSTRCGGQGVTIFYGMAKPVRAPQIGPTKPY